eukprot:m.67574 g.67574  ORF g.67574 m.67574 type:complete len:1066 (-) comp12715_c1_seq3:47-3244(-)
MVLGTVQYTNDVRPCANNGIFTSKYTLLTFLPKNLFEQFHRLANIYFLVLVILNWLPELNVFGKEISMLPLLLVLSATLVKDGIEDLRRHRLDDQLNLRPCTVVLPGGVTHVCPARDIKLGDALLVRRGDEVPADLVVLQTSSAEGTCYASSASFDGESALKMRYAVAPTRRVLQGDDGTAPAASCSILASPPSPVLDGFTAHVLFDRPIAAASLDTAELLDEMDPDTSQHSHTADSASLLPRGFVLQSTEWVVGMATYIGADTKLSRQTLPVPAKRTRLEKHLNRFISVLVALLACMCFGCAGGRWAFATHHRPFYLGTLPMDPDSFVLPLLAFLQCVLLFQVLVPIALYISLEGARLFLTYFIIHDNELAFVTESGERRNAECHAWNIVEDLGQVRCVFADKTGTLTRNNMTLVTFALADTVVDLKAGDPAALARIVPESDDAQMLFFLAMATCNTVFPQPEIQSVFEGESPDEVALVTGAARLGCTLVHRDHRTVTVEVRGVRRVFTVLQAFPFETTRRRMAVVLQENDTVFVFCKGADSALAARASPAHQQHVNHALHHTAAFANAGLRTLVIAAYTLTAQQYFERLRLPVTDSLRDNFECDLVLLGVTAVEDELAEGVVDTMATLREAHIRVWMLTGDKQETAECVARQAGLVPIGATLVPLLFEDAREDHVRLLTGQVVAASAPSVLVLDGDTAQRCFAPAPDASYTTEHVSEHVTLPAPISLRPSWLQRGRLAATSRRPISSLAEALASLSSRCASVVVFRCSPSQKSIVVSTMQARRDMVALAIGDGANDIGMLRAARIGVGVYGREGHQAARASDYAVGGVSALPRLLLVHGHWAYQRIAYLAIYLLYKNAMFVWLLFFFQPLCGFSAQTMLNDLYLILFSLLFTSLPCIVRAALDQPFSAAKLLSDPSLYSYGHSESAFSATQFALAMAEAAWQAGAVFGVPVLAVQHSLTPGLYAFGAIVMTAAVLTSNMHLALDTRYWPWALVAVFLGSNVLFFVFSLVYSAIPLVTDSGDFLFIMADPAAWLTILLASVVALLPRLIVRLGVHITAVFPVGP